LNRLPSVAELLDKPPIRALAQRWNRSSVAANVRSFLDELQRDLRRRAADVQLPSVRELAEKAARYVVSQQQQSLGTTINATGSIWGAAWGNRPLSDYALQRVVAMGREFVIEESDSQNARPMSVESLLCGLSGAEAAAVVHSYTGALWLALSALAAGREVIVSRAEVGVVGAADPLPKLAAAALAVLKEAGTTNCTLAIDYEAEISPRAAAILKLSSDGYCIVGETAAAASDELAALTRERELLLIDALGSAPLIDPPAALPWPHRSARSSIAAGVDLVLLRGDGLLGGPSCGILLGSRDAIRRVWEHPLFAAWRLDPLRSAALVATLECYDDSARGRNALPVWQFLTAPIDNLRNRAERIAPQLARAQGIASALPVETRSPICAAFTPGGGWPSYGIALTPADGDVHSLDKRLRAAPSLIRGRLEGDRLVLDLRTVFPRQDTQLVETLIGPPPANMGEGAES
jgi:L-seryl-tRNA(Ser) seleniumtransferase